MIIRSARVCTAHASSYLEMLCKHFEPQVQVRYDGKSGQIEFPFGHCELAATDAALKMRMMVESQSDLSITARVMRNQIDRFAVHEKLQLCWDGATPIEGESLPCICSA